MDYNYFLKLLNKPEDWTLKGRGTFTEMFVHKHGVSFFTGLDIRQFHYKDRHFEPSFLRWYLNGLTFKEYRFKKKWGKLND